MKVTSTFEIDKRDNEFATLKVRDNDNNYVRLLLINEGNNIKPCWLVTSFLSGKVNNTRYRQDRYSPKLYEKDGRGRESKISKEYMRELYSLAMSKALEI